MIKCRAFAILILLALLSLPCGCGSETRLSRLPLHGTVKMPNGEQLNGLITFLPAEGQSGPSANAKLDQGKYEFDRENGPTVGPHTVKIRRVVSRADSLEAMRAKQQPQVNGQEWTLSADLTDNGQYVQDFTINK